MTHHYENQLPMSRPFYRPSLILPPTRSLLSVLLFANPFPPPARCYLFYFLQTPLTKMSDSFKDSEVDMALWKMYHRSQLLVYSSIYIYMRRAKRRKTYHLPRRSWYDVAGWMHPGRFKRFMRMSRGAFEKLHQKCCDAETDFGIERVVPSGP